jgi:hypothetical protein
LTQSREPAAAGRCLIEERPGDPNVAGHSDLRVALQRFPDQRLRFFAIAWGGAIHQHHRMETAYLGLFERPGVNESTLDRMAGERADILTI